MGISHAWLMDAVAELYSNRQTRSHLHRKLRGCRVEFESEPFLGSEQGVKDSKVPVLYPI
jgi:hypothetical protein